MNYERYESVLADAKRAVRYYVGWQDDQLAEDITLSLLGKLPASASDGWFRVSIRHAAIKAARRQSRHTDAFPLHAELPRPDRFFDLEARLESLSPDALALVYLWLVGYQHAEIADQCGCSAGAVRARLCYALKQTRQPA